MTEKIEIKGGCHCSKIRFTALVAKQVKTLLCNCSICKLSNYEHLFIAHEDFVLESGKNNLSSYKFGAKKAEHLFCKTCGVKSFYQPRSHPESYSIHVAALDNSSDLEITQENFDGQNWEKAKSELG